MQPIAVALLHEAPSQLLTAHALAWSITLGLVALMEKTTRETTLRLPWRWLVLSVVGLMATSWLELFGVLSAPDLARIRFVAVMTTFCPIVALFGAKRPQVRAWPWIVLSLWVVLILPAIETSLLRRDRQPDLSGLRLGFVWILWILGWGNYVATRNVAAALFTAVAQGLLLWSCTTDGEGFPIPLSHVPPVCGLLAAALFWLPTKPGVATSIEDRWWRRFRDAYGAAWAIRVAERVNAAGRKRSWPFRIGWQGVAATAALSSPSAPSETSPSGTPPSTDVALAKEFRRGFRMVLRSFVSDAWLKSVGEAGSSFSEF